MTTVTTITRKEIANLLAVSIDTVERREKEWKLRRCLIRTIKRPVTYDRAKIEVLLVELLSSGDL